MPNAPAVVKFTEAFFDLHKATAPAALKNDLIMAGMTVNKGGYHSEIEWLRAHKPGDYSIQRAADRTSPGNYGAAVDITFRSAQAGNYAMISHYMKLAANGLRSPKVYAADGVTNTFREMIGTIDGKKPITVSFYREALLAQDDRSHMYHIHFSFTRRWLNDFDVYEPLLDLLFPDRPLPSPPPAPTPVPIPTEEEIAMAYPFPLRLIKVKGQDAVYAVTFVGGVVRAVHVQNGPALEEGRASGFYSKEPAKEVDAAYLNLLREKETNP